MGFFVNEDGPVPINLVFSIVFGMLKYPICGNSIFHILSVLMSSLRKPLACFPDILLSTSLATNLINDILLLLWWWTLFQLAKLRMQSFSALHHKPNFNSAEVSLELFWEVSYIRGMETSKYWPSLLRSRSEKDFKNSVFHESSIVLATMWGG